MRRLLLSLCLLSGVAAAEAPAAESGTTIVGEQESSVGLFLTPWQDERASDLDRPPSRLAPATPSLDATDFGRSAAAYETLLAYRREQLQRVH
ncbi:hypothetical protein D0B54_02250 [Solimonas sp. K1W22B-7]|uniref:hypothetical protein n=1 Tax=Solimonas sp. K1W22B-7 TaxID=2303331 RepID=UPI000E332933|nr:hypothetical protein [Solimonas sp. K1W22B-7]AXQ27570.1 hypothetical protein D0B54_02250 [Solimonas sp. K1W22B-7]